MSVTADVMDARPVTGTVHDYGDQALLLEFDSTAEVLAWTDALREAELLGVLDIVPGVAHGADQAGRAAVPGRRPGSDCASCGSRRRWPTSAPPDERADVVIDVVYDGEDLDEVARLTGLTAAEVVAAHTASAMASRIRRIRTGFRLPRRRGSAARTCRGARSRAPGCRPGRWRWPASSAASIPGSRPAAGS